MSWVSSHNLQVLVDKKRIERLEKDYEYLKLCIKFGIGERNE